MGYNTLFLDADGTLFDYDKAEEYALQKALQETGWRGNAPLYLYRRINTKIWEDFEQGKISPKELKVERFRRFFSELGFEFAPDKFSDLYLDHLSQASFLLPGAREVIEEIHGKYSLILLTNGLSNVQRKRLALSGLERFFSSVIISEEVGVAKPHPRIFSLAVEAANNQPKEKILMVGDSLSSDIRGGVNFGIDTCWIKTDGQLPEDFGPTYVIDGIGQILDILN